MAEVPSAAWKRRFDAKSPSSSVHHFSRPPVLEALGLLPVAYRVGSYISGERSNGREPIFDLNGITLDPPNPGPHAGVPLGGLGGGSIGRGFKGEFRRWSLNPGRYIHRNINSDIFMVRIRRGNIIYAKVLSIHQPDEFSCLSAFDFSMDPSCATYHAVFPRSWTVYEDPVPGIRVVIRQMSPFIPHNYSDSSLPVGVFIVEVENRSETDEVEVSILFSFQNGYDCREDTLGGYVHTPFYLLDSEESGAISGVCLAHHKVHMQETCNAPAHTVTHVPIDKNTPISATEATDDVQKESLHPPRPGSSAPSSAEEGLDPVVSVDQGSYAIASTSRDIFAPDDSESSAEDGVLSHCAQYITGYTPIASFYSEYWKSSSEAKASASYALEEEVHLHSLDEMQRSATNLWNQFCDSGDIGDDAHSGRGNVSMQGTKVGAAVCLRKTIPAGGKKIFPFSLAWDNPTVRFKGAADQALNRFYTRFFGTSGLSAPSMAAYALLHVSEWEQAIVSWQAKTLRNMTQKQTAGQNSGGGDNLHKKANSSTVQTELDSPGTPLTPLTPASTDPLLPSPHSTDPSGSDGEAEGDFYSHQLFNELYFLVDGGTVWTDTANGVNNPQAAPEPLHKTFPFGASPESFISGSNVSAVTEVEERHSLWSRCNGGEGPNTTSKFVTSRAAVFYGPTGLNEAADSSGNLHIRSGVDAASLDMHLSSQLSIARLRDIARFMRVTDSAAVASAGAQSVVGQFLYLEGHEYLMYNTYDVHFYSSFALLALWPQLELSLQRDFAAAVPKEDDRRRRMMGEGDIRPRKVKGIVPHDLGSPSEQPWTDLNAYNFQDVSRWKDLGPKFVLQIYRDFKHLHDRCSASDTILSRSRSPSRDVMLEFLRELFPTVLEVMQSTLLFDTDNDGMIENSGFPDQTYDIWIAKGVHAYCGGLWVTACEATAAMGAVLGDEEVQAKYSELAGRARAVYVSTLWNGRYLNYDSSSSGHHDSIMADMLAGQWYAHACQLPPVVSARMALSCFRTIYQMNVVTFGGGKFMGAVNGMKPSGRVDSCCLQSREVWTGTTYALAAGMIHEAAALPLLEELTAEERAELRCMAHNTARGVHDAGWQEFGYWFATPEAWERSGNYRSLGYMRPLSIWAMQFAYESKAGESGETAEVKMVEVNDS